MFEKPIVNQNKFETEKPLETINDLLKQEDILLERGQRDVSEKKKERNSKKRQAFLAITAGAMLLSATGCGVPFMIGAEAKNVSNASSAEMLFGPAAHPIEMAEYATEAFEREKYRICFYNNKVSLKLWYKKPFFYDKQIKRIVDDFVKKGWTETEDFQQDKRFIGYLSVSRNDDDKTFEIFTQFRSKNIKDMYETICIESIKEKDLMEKIEEVISTIEKDREI